MGLFHDYVSNICGIKIKLEFSGSRINLSGTLSWDLSTPPKTCLRACQSNSSQALCEMAYLPCRASGICFVSLLQQSWSESTTKLPWRGSRGFYPLRPVSAQEVPSRSKSLALQPIGNNRGRVDKRYIARSGSIWLMLALCPTFLGCHFPQLKKIFCKGATFPAEILLNLLKYQLKQSAGME